MSKILFTPKAISDLEEIEKYIKELCNEQAAIKVIDSILKKIEILGDFPDSGAPLSNVINIKTNYRFIICKSYIVFYLKDGTNIKIIRIIYGRRNYVQILFNTVFKD